MIIHDCLYIDNYHHTTPHHTTPHHTTHQNIFLYCILIMSEKSPQSPSSSMSKNSTLFKKVKWGSFSQQLKDYNTKHKTSKVKNLKSFSNLILKHPSKFHSKTKKRAVFYKNIIAPKSKKTVTQSKKSA
jgi:hypothetical protein